MITKIFSPDQLEPKIAVVVGTRPGIIKLSPIVRALERSGCEFFLIHTGQHYSPNMDQAFFDDLDLPAPRYGNEAVRHCKLHGEQTAEMIKGVERALVVEQPRVVIVGGDANTNLAGALAARKLGMLVAHLEAGLRSHDWRMPEEHNRVIIDHICEYLFPPTEEGKQNLVHDNVKGRMWVTGNTIVDAVYQNRELATRKSSIRHLLGLAEGMDYFLVTLHREENVDAPERLASLIRVLNAVAHRFGRPILFPLHPRTRERLVAFGLQSALDDVHDLRVVEPVGYLDFLSLLAGAQLVLTDSGGVQEEACILHVPCVTLRDNTERPETLRVGSNVLAGTNPDLAVEAASRLLKSERNWTNPFGDGMAGERIVSILRSEAMI